MNVLDLFSGIGGFSLGLERAGMRTVAFCECDPYCQRVLRKHWPDVPIFGDVRTLTVETLADTIGQQNHEKQSQPDKDEGGRSSNGFGGRRMDIQVICGGFPCQDISVAGKGAGITGERSGLWTEFARIIGEIRPRFVIVENVAALLGRGIERVLGDLAALGYDAEWHCIPASAVGAPHRRDRIWIVAYPNGDQLRHESRRGSGANGSGAAELGNDGSQELVADAARAERKFVGAFSGRQPRGFADEGWWLSEPDVGRVANGVPARVHRLRALGNAVVPQIPEIIGRAIMERENSA